MLNQDKEPKEPSNLLPQHKKPKDPSNALNQDEELSNVLNHNKEPHDLSILLKANATKKTKEDPRNQSLTRSLIQESKRINKIKNAGMIQTRTDSEENTSKTHQTEKKVPTFWDNIKKHYKTS